MISIDDHLVLETEKEFEQMREEGKDKSFNFKCTGGCSLCCTGELSLEIDEIFSYQNDFVIVLRLHAVMPIPSNEHNKDMIVTTPFGECWFGLGCETLDYNTGRCKMLSENNLCLIENRKPCVCKSVPLLGSVSPEDCSWFINHEWYKKNRPCITRTDIKSKDTLIFNGNLVEDHPLVQNYYEDVRQYQKTKSILTI